MKPIFLLLLVMGGFSSLAQIKQNVYFLDKNGKQVFSKDSATTIRVVREPDSGSVLYNVLEFYVKGAKKMVGRSSKIDPVWLEGTCVTYYGNGNKKSVANYASNRIVGTEFVYYPNGKLYTEITYSKPDNTDKHAVSPVQTELISTCNDSTGKSLVANGNGHYIGYKDGFKYFEEGDIKDGKRTGEWKGKDEGGKISFTEVYNTGQLISGTATDPAGTYTYHERMILPAYKGGVNEFYRYLGNNITYPIGDRERGVQGTVVVSFVININGRVSEAKLMRSVSPDIDKEALRVLNRSTAWLPGKAYGRQVKAAFTVPISFSLQ